MSIPSTLIAGFIRLASCASMGARIVHSLWLIEADPHRGGSLSLMPARMLPSHSPQGYRCSHAPSMTGSDFYNSQPVQTERNHQGLAHPLIMREGAVGCQTGPVVRR